MITGYRAAEICSALYGNVTPNPVKFEIVDLGEDDGICWAVSREGDIDVVSLRGSYTPEDWFRDAMADPYMSRRMGKVHRGFYLGMDNAWEDMQKVLRSGAPVVIVGHSLGAGRAALLTGIMIDAGKAPVARIVFGEPKPGFSELASYIAPVPATSFRNSDTRNHDLVTDLPFTLPALGLNYVHPTLLIDVNGSPDPTDQSGMFVYHHIDLYMKAMKIRGEV